MLTADRFLMKDIKFYKLVVFVNALVPLALVAWDWRRGQLGANPLDFVTRTTGTLTLVFLVLTLAVTPLRKWTGANWLVRLRRMVGLYAFFYGSLHFLTYVWFDKWFDLGPSRRTWRGAGSSSSASSPSPRWCRSPSPRPTG